MKTRIIHSLWVVTFMMSLSILHAQNNVAINNTGSAPDSSAMLDVQSTTKGMLVPRMTSQQRELIFSPAEGLLVYDSDTESFWLRQSTQWSELVSGKTGLRDMDNDTKVVVEETPDDDIIRFFAGGRNFGFLSWSDSLETNIGFDAGSYASGTWGTHIGYKAGYFDSGFKNTIVGSSAGKDTLSGDYNTFIGSSCGTNTQSGYGNTFAGALSGLLNLGGYHNSFVGFQSGRMNTTGNRNSFFGVGAGVNNVSGIQNTFIGMSTGNLQKQGENNTYLGVAAGQGSVVDTNGSRNTALGAFSGYLIGIGERNTLVGSYSGYQLTAGIQNTFLGASSGNSTNLGERNVFLGDAAGFYNTVGSWNTFIGEDSGVENVDGNYNVFAGQASAYNNTSGSGNTVIGHVALYSNVDRSYMVAIGDSALYNNGMNATQSYEAVENTAVGSMSLLANTTGSGNTGIGYKSLYKNTTGYYNTATGYRSLALNTTGFLNTATGYGALASNISGDNNTAFGYYSLVYNGGGNNNAAFGKETLYFNSSGASNTAIGSLALFNNFNGDFNTAIGYNSLYSNTTGDQNTVLGYNADVSSSNLTNATAIGANAIVSKSNSLVLGNGASVSIGNSSPNQLLSVGDDFGAYLIGNRITIGNNSGFSGLNIGEDIDNRAFILWNGSNNLLEMGTSSGGSSYGSTFIIKNGRAGINNSAPQYDLHVGDGTLGAVNGSDTRMVVSDNDNEDRAAVLGLAKTSAGARVEAQLEANGSNTAGPSVIVGAASSHPLYIRTGNLTRMTVTSAGDVGIGTSSPSTKLEVNGNVTATCGVLSCSDARYKHSIAPVTNVLQKLRNVTGVYYYWDRDTYPDKNFSSERQIGIIAQALETYYPELVHTDRTGYKTVDYAKFSAVLLQGLHEQQEEIEQLKEQLSKQQHTTSERLSMLEEKLAAISNTVVSAPKRME